MARKEAVSDFFKDSPQIPLQTSLEVASGVGDQLYFPLFRANPGAKAEVSRQIGDTLSNCVRILDIHVQGVSLGTGRSEEIEGEYIARIYGNQKEGLRIEYAVDLIGDQLAAASRKIRPEFSLSEITAHECYHIYQRNRFPQTLDREAAILSSQGGEAWARTRTDTAARAFAQTYERARRFHEPGLVNYMRKLLPWVAGPVKPTERVDDSQAPGTWRLQFSIDEAIKFHKFKANSKLKIKI